jgi:lysine biosynthesis protein LysW
MNDQITTNNGKFTCSECQNEVELSEGKKVGDVIECPFCGIEYEIVSQNEGSTTLIIVEEEK